MVHIEVKQDGGKSGDTENNQESHKGELYY